MTKRRQCPFCLSLAVKELGEHDRLVEHCCNLCQRRWAEARPRPMSEAMLVTATSHRGRRHQADDDAA